MKRLISILVLLGTGALAGQLHYEVSEDGRLSTVIDPDEPSSGSFITDVVPYNMQPDWSLNLRMQVGGFDIGDLDDDGDIDLVVGCYHSQSYPPYPDWRNFILYNTGSGFESSPSWWSEDSSSTTDVCIADFNSDGLPDVFAANGDFSFDPSVIYYHFDDLPEIDPSPGWYSADNCWSTGAAAFDFDQDGDVDVATSNQGVSPDPYRPVHIFINNGGMLEETPSWSSSASEISGDVNWGDYSHDGWYDLAVSKWVNFYSCVYRNNSGSVGHAPIWQANNSNSQKGVGWSDINGDNYPELAIGGSGLPTQLYGNDNGVLTPNPIWESQNSFHGCQDLAWADVDNDGDEDLADVHFSNGHLRVYLNVEGQLSQTPSWQYDDAAVGTAVAFGDVDGDGGIDLIMGVSGQPCVKVFYNTLTSVDDDRSLPDRTQLLANYPNPFNTETRISFQTAKPGRVQLQIFDLRGLLVRTLVDGHLAAGQHYAIWDGRDAQGSPVASGVYFYRLIAGEKAISRKIVVVR